MTTYERITVNLTQRVSNELSDIQQLEELSKTDVINRALLFYAFLVKKQINDGYVIYIKDPNSNELERITIL